MLEIVEEGLVQAALDRALDEWDGCLVAWEAVTWAIARDPRCAGVPLYEGATRYVLEYHGAMSIKQPTIYVVYSVNLHQIIIHDVKFSRPRSTFSGYA